MHLTQRGESVLRTLSRLDVVQGLGTPIVAVSRLAESERISTQYLENFFSNLKAAGDTEGIQGKAGGVRLFRDPENTKMGELVRFLAGLLTRLGSRGTTER